MSIFKPFFDIVETGGGGDCLFYTINYLLGGKKKNLEQATWIRRSIVSYQYNPNDDDFCPLNDPNVLARAYLNPEEVASIEDVISMESGEMGRKKEWGTEYELMKAAKLFERPILVYTNKPVLEVQTCSGAWRLCPDVIEEIRNGRIFRGVRKYLLPPYNQLEKYLLCIYLPNHDTSFDPFIIYNRDNVHYQAITDTQQTSAERKVIEQSYKQFYLDHTQERNELNQLYDAIYQDEEEDEGFDFYQDVKDVKDDDTYTKPYAKKSVCEKYKDAVKENCIISFGKKKSIRKSKSKSKPKSKKKSISKKKTVKKSKSKKSIKKSKSKKKSINKKKY